MQLSDRKRIAWQSSCFFTLASLWCLDLRRRRAAVSARSVHWWHFICATKTHLPIWVDKFVQGQHQFSPMLTCRFPDKTVIMWHYLDRLMVYLLFLVLRPTFKHIIPKTCVSTEGPSAIKKTTRMIKTALQSQQYQYALRIDIKSYYASIDRTLLLKQLYAQYDDPKIRHYLNAIVFHAVGSRGQVWVAKKGIPLRSSLSPFLGALYLAPLDLAFQSMDVFYCRYVDDIIILVKSEHQYRKAKKRLFSVTSI